MGERKERDSKHAQLLNNLDQYEGMTVAEIADALELSPNTVKKILSEAEWDYGVFIGDMHTLFLNPQPKIEPQAFRDEHEHPPGQYRTNRRDEKVGRNGRVYRHRRPDEIPFRRQS